MRRRRHRRDPDQPVLPPGYSAIGRDIQNRLNEITFNTSLLKELRSLDAEWAFLTDLRDRGREAAGDWPARHYEDIGDRNTLDLSWIFEESLKPAHLPEGAARGTAIKEAALLRAAAES